MNLLKTAHAAGAIDDAPRFSEIGMNALNFLLSAAGTIAVIGLAVSGVLYFTAGGDEKKMQLAKRAAKYSIYGIAAALSAWVIINTLASFL